MLLNTVWSLNLNIRDYNFFFTKELTSQRTIGTHGILNWLIYVNDFLITQNPRLMCLDLFCKSVGSWSNVILFSVGHYCDTSPIHTIGTVFSSFPGGRSILVFVPHSILRFISSPHRVHFCVYSFPFLNAFTNRPDPSSFHVSSVSVLALHPFPSYLTSLISIFIISI